jgi:endonuclease-8
MRTPSSLEGMAEGDTIHRTAQKLQETLGGRLIEEVAIPNPESRLRQQGQRVERLRGSTMTMAEARGKHLLLHFDCDLVLHSHLGMRGSWRIRASAGKAARARRAWIVLSVAGIDAVELDGSHLALITEAELRSDPRLRTLGPDVLGPGFDAATGVARLRGTDQSRQLGEALLDQRVLSGVGNIYKCEGCWSARIDPWQRLADLGDDELQRVVIEVAALMRFGLETGRMPRSLYRRAGQACPRCGARIQARGQGDANRTTYWCVSCQTGESPPARDNPLVREER